MGNHDPAYNDLGWTIKKQKQFLHDKFPEARLFESRIGLNTSGYGVFILKYRMSVPYAFIMSET